MGSRITRAAALIAALIVGGCAGATDDLWPTLTGEEPAGPSASDSASAANAASTPATSSTASASGTYGADSAPSPTISGGELYSSSGASSAGASSGAASSGSGAMGATASDAGAGGYSAGTVLASADGGTTRWGGTGTFVGAKVAEFARELENLKAQVGNANARYQQLRQVTEQNAQRYYAIVAAISARLQIGTTPGNPVLVSQWNTAQSELDRILTDIAALNTLANDVASQAAMASYLLEAINAAYGLSGAVEEDHRQLARLEDEVNRTIVLIDRLLGEINETIQRQTAYVNNERRNLTTLSLAIKNGEMFGPPLASRAFAVAAATSSRESAQRTTPSGEPLVVIRFDRPDVPFEQALYTAVSQALDRRPSATFDIVAIAPNRGTPAEVALKTNEARRDAERVFRSLTEMGLPPERVRLSATTDPAVQTIEVHVYVR